MAYEFLTNETEKSFDIYVRNPSIAANEKKNARKAYNKQKSSLVIFDLFMKNKPAKPENVVNLGTWKGLMSIVIKDGIKTLQHFMKEHKMKTSKIMIVSKDFLINKKNVSFIRSKFQCDKVGSKKNTDTGNNEEHVNSQNKSDTQSKVNINNALLMMNSDV